MSRMAEGRPHPLTSFRKKSNTLDLASFLNTSFAGGFWSSWRGWGSWYMRCRSRNWTNQDVEHEDVTRTCCAYTQRGVPGRWHIILKRDICFRWRIAVPGSDPAIKWTSEAGELVDSLIMLWSFLLNCWSMQATSLLDSTRLDRPDRRTRVPQRVKMRREAEGFEVLPCAKPQETVSVW